jgi:hypothetical protein
VDDASKPEDIAGFIALRDKYDFHALSNARISWKLQFNR